jgi:tetratricopeptide (TPR) repeat protein
MKRAKPSDVHQLCGLLLKQQKYEKVIQLLETYLSEYEDTEGWARTSEFIEQMPDNFRYHVFPVALIYAKALRIQKRVDELLEWSNRVAAHFGVVESATIQSEIAGGLNWAQRYSEARVLLEQSLPHLKGESLGVTWSRLGFALFYLKQPWREAYACARALLTGHELGRALLNEGHCLEQSNLRVEARKVWLEALACFHDNPYSLAWTRYNLGMNALRDSDLEAERHFLEAIRHTQSPKAVNLRPAALNGLAAFHRSLGEWNRAETAYRQVLRLPCDPYDREQAYRGVARTFYLSARPVQALEVLELALHEPTLAHHMIHLARAMAFLVLGQTSYAKSVLAQVGNTPSESNRWLLRIAQAELARQEGRLDEAVALLDGLPLHTLHAREEVRQFPLLFDLLRAAGKEVPQPLEYVQGTTVWVKAQGVLEVSVNGRPIEMHPTSRVGELLVFLLEQGGAATLEVIEDALYSSRPYSRRRQAIWNLVKKLREALGWEDSVRSLHRAYQLDPAATWHYDIAQARARGEFGGEFLVGVYSNWAREVEIELQSLNPPASRRDLN